MREPAEYLREHLLDMQALLNLHHEEASYGDMIRLEIDAPEEEVPDCWNIVEAWYLDIATATWDTDGRPLCRVELVTGTGGPHTELIGHYSRHGDLQRVEAHQYWSGHREAWTTDRRALEVFEAFREAFVYVDGQS